MLPRTRFSLHDVLRLLCHPDRLRHRLHRRRRRPKGTYQLSLFLLESLLLEVFLYK
jgi:hypothetical protein